MKKNGLFEVMLVMILAFGMVLVGCDSTTDDDNGGNSLVAAEGANKVSGKTYFEESEKIEFSVTSDNASSGTYKVLRIKYNNENGQPILEDGKYTYQEIENGAYSWNETTKTVTLKPEKVAQRNSEGYGSLGDKAAYRTATQAMLNQYKEQMGEAALNKQLDSMGFSTIAAYIDYYAAEAFADKTHNYAFSADDAALFLDKVLPANKGSNELVGQTYNGTTWEDGELVKDDSEEYVFTSSGYTYKGYGETSGTYAYDSSRKIVYLKPSTTGRQTRYDSITGNDSEYFNNVAEYKAAQTNDQYRMEQRVYDVTLKTIQY
jgi:hypothetical protein